MESILDLFKMVMVVVVLSAIMGLCFSLIIKLIRILAVPIHLGIIYIEMMHIFKFNYRIPKPGTPQRIISDCGAILMLGPCAELAIKIFKNLTLLDYPKLLLSEISNQAVIVFFIGLAIIIFCSWRERPDNKTPYQKLEELNILDILLQFK